MGELVAFNPTTPNVPALSMGEIERVALAIAKGGLFGSTDPNAVLTLCLLAHAEGQHPAVVFRDYHLIKGKPAKKADAMLRDFVSAGGKVEWHKLDDTTADATFSHPGGGTVRIDWTLDRAKTAGLATDMWRKYPRQMLRSRVISEGVRTVYPGATSGLYEVGEVQDIVAETPPAAEPRNDPPQRDTPAIEHQPKPTRSPPLQGLHKTRAALKEAIHAVVVDMKACSDRDMLDIVMRDNKETIDQCREEHEYWWNGDGMDFIGLSGEIAEAYKRFDPDPNAPTILDAG